MIHRLTIPGKLPSLNDLIEENRKSPRTGAKLKRETQDLIHWHILAQLKHPIKTPVRIICIFCEPDERRDLDNVYSAHKYILDALVAAEKLPGDGQKYITGIVDEATVDKVAPRVEVILIEQ